MTAMERIKEFEDLLSGDNCYAVPDSAESHHDCGQCGFNGRYLLKAFRVMREIAIEEGRSDEWPYRDTEGAVDDAFEEKMRASGN